ncbi:DUF6338 family protein [Mitsuaria sp. GD03876]|uniref:DUF6338 family protein n=1 Tax=Mitsuaria sp. GD03876 TaxID=2975399 RepID=UPI002446F5BC|nr:DUF6338 family protein [Mitsuaria sp. GD03876]MDH0865154.1 hypothetical protein [Mitsuaria sp. GD03876]
MQWITKENFEAAAVLLSGIAANWIYGWLTMRDSLEISKYAINVILVSILVAALKFTFRTFWNAGIPPTPFPELAVPGERAFDLLLGALFGLMGAIASDQRLVWQRPLDGGMKLKLDKSISTSWPAIFKMERGYVILNLKNGDRLLGWPLGRPEKPDAGHFHLIRTRWLRQQREREAEPPTTEHSIVIAAIDVAWIQFIGPRGLSDPALSAAAGASMEDDQIHA